jgi:hypothetical protein
MRAIVNYEHWQIFFAIVTAQPIAKLNSGPEGRGGAVFRWLAKLAAWWRQAVLEWEDQLAYERRQAERERIERAREVNEAAKRRF